jgi:hypothetical protein
MRHCYSCGKDEPDDMLYCTQCGRQLELQPFEHQAGTLPYIAAPTEQLPVRSTQQPTMLIPAPRKRKSLWLLLLLPVIALCGIGGFLLKLADTITTQRPAPVAPVVNIARNTTLDTNAIMENLNAEMTNTMTQYNAALKELANAANKNARKASQIGHEKQQGDDPKKQ